MRKPSFALLVAGVAACSASTVELPPLGEALVVVDTDLPVPKLAGRLRVDAYTEDLIWYASRDDATLDPSSWPVSFSVYSADPSSDRTVLLRLRAYPESKVRDYHGERFADRPDPPPPPPPDEGPRLLADDGSDITPPEEPQPLVTVDRLLLVHVVHGTRGSVHVVLRGACAGTMVDLSNEQTCVDTENARIAVMPETLDPDMSPPQSTLAGGFDQPTPCSGTPRPAHDAPDGTPLFDEEVCVPGGAFVFGAPDQTGIFDEDAVPERVAVLSPFYIDRYEVTVARLRAAEASLTLSGVLLNGSALPKQPSDDFSPQECTFSATPIGREGYPVNCITFALARAFCRLEGGDLPTEAQWEYAAAMSGRPVKTAYPWGPPDDILPTCAQAVLDRGATFLGYPGPCGQSLGFGPASEDAAAGVGQDVSVTLGIANLGGSVSEYTLDSFHSLGSSCWLATRLENPTCQEATPSAYSLRGGSWVYETDHAYYGYRRGSAGGPNTSIGFRCARSAQ